MANGAPLKSCEQLFCYLLVVAFITSCAASRKNTGSRHKKTMVTPGGAVGGPPLLGGRPTAHAWQYLYSYGGEEYGYATYSYVLVGRDKNNQAVISLYCKLIKSIQSSTVSAYSLPKEVSKANFNLFLIPIKNNISTGTQEPNYELSKLLLTALSTKMPSKFSAPGPYIITLYKPIRFGKHDEVADILYVDLTNIHPAAIPEIVRAYKNKILEKDLSGFEKLQSLRLSLLELALIAEDSIGFAQAAYAKLQNAFSE